MSESDGEQAARSLALEQAYVHEVYEQCADRTVPGRHWPRIYQFLEELEPGALVCDIGCGNGKYLNVNHNVFKIGVDRCKRFTNIARDKEKNEVLACDNLSLPFRDESFDAVLSIAVVHHFSTTERRVRALKELARVLRIGGRLIISVWAMEQKHRKFESQDVLVPWPKAYCVSSSGSPINPRGMSFDDRHRGKNAQTYLLSKRSSQRKGSTNKSYWVDPIFSPSPSTSSLSSPNETCYSFFRRALQKLAGGRRSSRAWFLENWQNGKDRRHYDDDDGDVDDLPIELRRLEDPAALANAVAGSGAAKQLQQQQQQQRPQLQQQHSDSLSVKSKSLSNIVEVQRLDLVRSRSSIPGLCNASVASVEEADLLLEPQPAQHQQQQQQQQQLQSQQQSQSQPNQQQQQQPQQLEHGRSGSLTSSKPRLVKQKTHFLDDACLDGPENTAIQQLLKDVPELQVTASASGKRGNVHKQSSMNEELMSIERLKERESVRKNIMKQASLNEELIYKSRPAFESFKDTFYSGSARFQLLKSGLTNRIKQSTTNIEKVSGMSIKNGFVRILQSWKSTESPATNTTTTTTTTTNETKSQTGVPTVKREGGADGIERRLSREDGSDSSKDSSLQSDTSVDSEDSFASVIYVPKKNSSPLIEAAIGPGPPAGYQLNTTSAPPSPRVKYAPELAGPHRLKLMSMSPLLKQFPATSKSLPPPSPPGLSPRTLHSANMRPFFSGNEAAPPAPGNGAGGGASLLERIAEVKRSFDVHPPPRLPPYPSAAPAPSSSGTTDAKSEPTDQTQSQTISVVPTALDVLGTKATSPARQSSVELPSETKRVSLQSLRGYKSMSIALEPEREEPAAASEDTSPLINDTIEEALEELSEKSLSSADSASATSEDDESRRSRLNQIKELLRQKPGFATRAKPSFPLVRRASTSATSAGRLDTVTKVLPRLLSLELFNPETDDLDSDSSGVSSPESVGSVISVISDERYASRKEAEAAGSGGSGGKSEEASNSSGDATDTSKDMASMSCSSKPDDVSSGEAELSQNPSTDDSDSLIELSSGSSQSLRLLEAAANVANTLEDAVGTLIQQKSLTKSASVDAAEETRTGALDKHISPVESTWNEECKKQLIDLTDRLSENLIHDIYQFCRKTKLELADEEFSSPLASTRNTSTCKYDSGLKEEEEEELLEEETVERERASPRQRRYNGDHDNNKQRSSDSGTMEPLIQRSCSEDSDAGSSGGGGGNGSGNFVVVTSSGEFLTERELQRRSRQRAAGAARPPPRHGNSMESSDIGDSIENTISESSQATSGESLTTRRFCSGSTASLGSAPSSAGRARLSAQTRSASEEIPSTQQQQRQQLHQQQQQQHRRLTPAAVAAAAASRRSAATSASNGTLSGSSSQESLPSDQITYHQYYHVFREGELDQLINKYVENLHIISSYYDHASWCIVAEKVQVWTI